jgi:hypothetical protein
MIPRQKLPSLLKEFQSDSVLSANREQHVRLVHLTTHKQWLIRRVNEEST